ncbi:MAG: 1-(5-phosphoribosyl)-5-[(5-phosphoribosylamino)methylideneamino]imidazole-4-carboxamide isomerase [Methanobacteriota archaeon]
MKVIPAVDLKGGQCVQLVGGDPNREAVVLPDPVSVAKEFSGKGAKLLHIVDLDAALGRGENRTLVEAIVKEVGCPVQVGGGNRSTEAVERWLRAGAERVVVGTKGVEDPSWLAEIAGKHPKKIVLAVDARGDRVATRGWTADAGKDLFEVVLDVQKIPLAGLLYTDVSHEGRLVGANVAAVRDLVKLSKAHPIIASGGISTLDDLLAIRDTGAWGAVVGMAIYKKRFTLEEAIRVVDV